jgi:hypothetical protein
LEIGQKEGKSAKAKVESSKLKSKNCQRETGYFSFQLSQFLLLPFRTLPPVVELGARLVD